MQRKNTNINTHALTKRIRSVGSAILAFVFMILMQSSMTAQSNQVTGTVIDGTGEALIGVTIAIQGKDGGAATDVDGTYAISATSDDVLEFSYVGFQTQLVPVNGQSVINITLSEDSELLEEVVVIGYGKQKKSHLTGSVSKVSNEQLDQIPLSRVDDALTGQIAGVNLSASNPAAGEAPRITIRGQGSISFESTPLIVVDGIAVGNDADYLASIDMNDVESVEVLKDAASSAIYGSRGANGIIMITTKAGTEGPTKFSYDSYIGFKEVPESGLIMGIDEWLAFVEQDNGSLTPRAEFVQRLGTETKWEEVMMDGGMIQSHSLSARGGTKNTRFRASLSYLDDEGVLLTDNYEKINFKLNLDTKVSDRIDFGISLNPSFTEQRRFPIGIQDAVRSAQWNPIFHTEHTLQFIDPTTSNLNSAYHNPGVGDWAVDRQFDDYNLDLGINVGDGGPGRMPSINTTSNVTAYQKVVNRDRRRFQTKLFTSAYVNVNITDDLFFKQTFGGDVRFTKNRDFIGVFATRNAAGDSRADVNVTEQFHTVNESTLNFNKSFNKHELSAVAGFAFEKWDLETSDINGIGYSNDLITTIATANVGVGGASTVRFQESLVSYFGRVNYAFDDKYLVSISARTDGSSKFGADTKYGFFPAVSLGWNVGREDFLADNSFIEDLKIRASYGESGSNNGIGRYAHLGQLAPVSTGFGGTGFNQQNIANADLGWESLRELNLGFDLSVLNGRIAVGFDWYDRTSADLLLNLPIPSTTGFQTALVNKGEVKNTGVELEIRTKNVSTKDFSWSSSALFTANENTLTDFAGASGLVTIADDKRAAEWIALEGQPISSFYGYVVESEIEDQYREELYYPIGAETEKIYIKDLNGDGVIDTDDRTILGDPYPDLIWSLNNTFRYKQFDLSFMFQGSHGAEVRNISAEYINQRFSGPQDNYTDDIPNPEALTFKYLTSEDIQNASYVALRNLNIGYTFPKSFLDRVGINKFRVYVGAQNLLYIMSKDYRGYNPEGNDGYQSGRRSILNYGYQRGPAPIYRTLSAGVNLQF